MLEFDFINSKTDKDNYTVHFIIDETYEFQIKVPKDMAEILDEDDERNPFYLNLATTEHYEGG